MSIESITKRILGEAQAYADERKAEAQAQKDKILADARIEADKIEADAKARAAEDSRLVVERRQSVAGLESRKMKLNAKQEVIHESFEKALEKMLSMSEKDYLAFISRQLEAFGDKEGEILLNAEDYKKYGAKIASGLKGGLKLGEETADIRGGFILKQGDIFINNSIEKLLADKKGELTGVIAAKLFPEE